MKLLQIMCYEQTAANKTPTGFWRERPKPVMQGVRFLVKMSVLSFSKKEFTLSLLITLLCLLLLHFWGMNIIVNPNEASFEGRRSDLGAFITGFLGLAYGLTGIVFELIKPLLPRKLNKIWTKNLFKNKTNIKDET